MSEYSTGPAAVRKEVLLRSSGFRHTLDFSVLAHAKWGTEHLPSPLPFPLSGGTDAFHGSSLQG